MGQYANPDNPDERNPVTVEGILNMFNEDFKQDYAAGNSIAVTFVEDQIKINKVLNDIIDLIQSDSLWHNNAFEFTARDTTEAIVYRLVTDQNPSLNLADIIQAELAMAYTIGYLVGRENEVHKCRCKHTDTIVRKPADPWMN